ncbi:MAG: rhodanese-like domain-containing protein [Candidatus Peribacteraceae bacterium]
MPTARTSLSILVISLIGGMLGGRLSTVIAPTNTDDLIAEYYQTESAVHVSPHGLRKKIAEGKNESILVDLRSAQEYEKEHIVGAVNIPAYSDPDHSAYDEVDRIVAAFKALPQDKSIIVYCYSIPCMTGRKVGVMLAENGIYVQHLGIGWNEWRHFWQLWNHEHEWKTTNVMDYVATGKEPGVYKGPVKISPCTEGEFGC